MVKISDDAKGGYATARVRWVHATEIRERHGYREFTDPLARFRLARWLYALCWTGTDRPSVLFDRATAWLVTEKVLLPGASALERLIARIRARAGRRLWRALAREVTREQRVQLEALLVAGEGGRPTSAIRRDAEHQPVSAKQLALDLPKKAWRRVAWREGTNTRLASRFAAVRVRPAHRDYKRSTPRPEEWCLIEWPSDEAEPTKYVLSTLPASTSRRDLVNATKLRWRIERDYQDLKQELGLGHYEGRGWRGFHHHATLCIAAYGFLISEKGAIPPSGLCDAVLVEEPPLSRGFRPRGSPDPA